MSETNPKVRSSERVEAPGAAGAGPAGIIQERTEPSEQIGQKIGRYKLRERIGEGGYGVVYAAEQEEPIRRRVALKVIKLGMDTRSVIARFDAERQALARMDHPNIAKVLDAGSTESGRPYFVMELVKGIRITDYCDQNNLSTRERLELFITVCHAVQHAHQKGIIHRDLKPSNILVTLQDGQPVPKVIDFGIAKATEGRLTDATLYTQQQQLIGTPAYMSPEQAEMSGLDVDTRSDIYSLGVVLYELLTGRTPLEGKELAAAGIEAMRWRLRETEAVRPSTRLLKLNEQELSWIAKHRAAEPPRLISQIRGDLDWIVMRCLEKDRTRRYETANALAQDIGRYLTHEPVVARPPTTTYKVQKFVRRNRAFVGAGSMIVAALVLGILGSAWQAARATREQQAASQARSNEVKERAIAEARLYESLLREAKATRINRRAGYREEVFELLRKAHALNVPGRNLLELRREAIGCLGDFVGLTPTLFAEYPTKLFSFRVHPGGLLTASLLGDGTVLLNEVPSGKRVWSSQGEPGTGILCFSLTGDQLVSIHWPEESSERDSLARSVVHLYGLNAVEQWHEVQRLVLPGVAQCVASAKGLWLVVADFESGSARLVDLKTQEVLHRFKLPKERTSRPVVDVSPDGRYLVAESAETEDPYVSVMDVWDLASRECVRQLTPHMALCIGPRFSPDGKHLALLCLSGFALYSSPTFERVAAFNEMVAGPRSVAFMPRRSVLALASADRQRVRIWDYARNQDLAILNAPHIADGLEFTYDGSYLTTAGTDQRARDLYRLKLPEERVNLAGHPNGVPGIAFAPDGAHLASVARDRKLRFWEAGDGTLVWEAGPLPGDGQAVAFSPDGKLLVTTSFDTLWVGLWDSRTGMKLADLGTNAPGFTWSAQFSPDGRYLVTASSDNTFPRGGAKVPSPGLNVWAIEPRAEPPRDGPQVTHLANIAGQCCGLVFAPSGNRVAFLKNTIRDRLETVIDTDLYVWDVGSATSPRMLARAVRGFPYALSFTRDGCHIMCLDTNRMVVKLDATTGARVHAFPTVPPGTRGWNENVMLFLSPDGSKLALSSPSAMGMDVWDAKTGQLLFPLPEQQGTVWCMAWSPESRRLAVSRSNGDIAIWNLPQIEQVLAGLGLQLEKR